MDLSDFALLAPVSLFLIINPFSCIPSFLSMTPGETPAERVRAARTASVVAAVALMFFAYLGKVFFSLLDVDVPALQIAGGILLFLIGLDMLRSPDSTRRLSTTEQEIAREKEDVAVTPLGIPLLCGPGSISTAIVLQSQAGSVANNVVLLVSIPLVYLACFLILRFAAVHAERLNPILIKVMRRMMGLLFAIIAVQFVINGLAELGVLAKVSAA